MQVLRDLKHSERKVSGWGHDLSGRTPAKQVQGPEFKF
jgi:hypothetical protein